MTVSPKIEDSIIDFGELPVIDNFIFHYFLYYKIFKYT